MCKIQERKEKKASVNYNRPRAEKAKAQEEYSEANRQAKKGIKADRLSYVEDLAADAEEAASHGNIKKLYATNKKLSGKYSKPESPVKDREDRAVVGEEEQRK